MAMLLAPYNNAMRLGQGFNSYTQQICLDQAVLPDTTSNRALLAKAVAAAPKEKPSTADAGSESGSAALPAVPVDPIPAIQDKPSAEVDKAKGNESEGVPILPGAADEPESKSPLKDHTSSLEKSPWSRPQIVTYSSRFVDKLSDITDSMNISGSLSIKTATIGGKANGSYIDSDKFKSSDINFHLQVRVSNQIHDATDYNIFNKIPILPSQFTEVYGDTFISGWEEGGELNAIISVKVLNKAKIFSIKAGLEAELTTPGIGGKLTADANIEKSTLNKETETTITVNWSGGGSIKNPNADWSITTLKAAAAAFPEMVAVTPQRTHAILTKYTALESFHKQQKNFSPLDYENAGIYTGALLDAYMDYKVLWKQISSATYELEAQRATIDLGEPSEEMAELAKVKDLPHVIEKTEADKAREAQALAASSPDSAFEIVGNGSQSSALVAGSSNTRLIFTTDSEAQVIKVFSPSFAGLIKARKICRLEMSKIVREVDHVAKDPAIALDPDRDEYFLPPLVFKQLLPIIRSLSAENRMLGVRDPTASLLLGYPAPKSEDRYLPRVYKLHNDFKDHAVSIRKSFEKVAHRARDYTIQGCAGIIREEQLHSQAQVINQLDDLDPTYRPVKISLWSEPNKVQGIELEFSNGKKKTIGPCTGTKQELALGFDGTEVVTEVRVEEAVDQKGVPQLRSLSLATSALRMISTAVQTEALPNADDGLTFNYKVWSKPDDTRYSLRGFFAAHYEGAVCTLAAVWGRDTFVPVPMAPLQVTLCKNFLGLSSDLQSNLRGNTKYAGKFLTGSYIDTTLNGKREPVTPEPSTSFDAMDTIDVSWRINNLGFAAVDGKLTGLKVKYHNGTELTHGVYSDGTAKWTCDVRSDLTIVKMTAGSLDAKDPSFIDTIEFVRAEHDGEIAEWPMNVATVRFLGTGEERALKNATTVIERAPKIGYEKLSVRGFFGECKNGIISKLGVIWGSS